MYRCLLTSTLLLTLACWGIASASAGGKKVQPQNLGKINTKADEDDPFILPENTGLLYATNAGGNWSIMLSKRQLGAKTWPAGKVFSALAAKDVDFRSPFATREGKVYFASNEVPDDKLKDLKNFDIKVRVSGREALPLLGISSREDELHPWITPAGKELYFSRKSKEGWLLMVARGPNPGPIGEPKAVGFAPGFHHASLSSSGLLMYLQGPVEQNRVGLYRSRRTKVGAAWSKPEPLTMLNSTDGPRGDLSPCLSSDGSRLYFASDRPGGMGGTDLWYIETASLGSAR
jgi:hypothetical protein